MLIERARAGEIVLVVSEVTDLELTGARPEVRAVLDDLPAGAIEKVELTAEARALSEQYIAAGVIGPRMAADARHIAIATTSGVDVLASCNFKHIVNLRRVHGDDSINLRRVFASRDPQRLEPDTHHDAAWAAELRERIRAVEAGEMKLISEEDADGEVEELLR